MEWLTQYTDKIQQAMQSDEFKKSPVALYEPINYILSYGGKRLRPVMVLLANDLYGGDFDKAMSAAIGIEYFHNFTLMHDDIMDEAPLRRGQETVHLKYGLNSGILSGDALFVQAYRKFEVFEPEKFKRLIEIFSYTAEALCEGQQYDMIFENQLDVRMEDYLKMIEFKTGVMVGSCFQIGAIGAGASENDAKLLYEFGKNLGIAFQIKDDYLDVFGSLEAFGKKHAGDIYENKKTVLYIYARQAANEEQLKELDFWYRLKTENVDKIYAVESLFKRLDVRSKTITLMNDYTKKAKEFLNQVEMDNNRKQPLYELADYLMQREI